MRKLIVPALAIVLIFAFVTGAPASLRETYGPPDAGDIIPFGGYDWHVLDVKNGRALLEIEPLVINADSLHDVGLPFGIDEVSDEETKALAKTVAELIVEKYIT